MSKEYKRLGGKGKEIEIVLIGGGAILGNYSFRNITTDIDAYMPKIGILKDAIANIALKHNIPNDWINSDFVFTDSYSPKLLQFSKPYKIFNQVLNVRIISGEYLVAMKLKSSRKYKNDLSDIVGILYEHQKCNNTITKADIEKAIVDLYGNWEGIPQETIDFIDSILALGDYSKIYDTLKEYEKTNKDAIVFFEEKYPNVLTNNNLDIVLKPDNESSLLNTLKQIKQDIEK